MIIVVPLTLILPHVAGLGVMGVFLAEPISNSLVEVPVILSCMLLSLKMSNLKQKNDKNSSYSFNDGTRKCLVRKDGKRKWIIWTCWKTKVFTY